MAFYSNPGLVFSTISFLVASSLLLLTNGQGREDSKFPQRLLAPVADQGEEVKALLLQKKLESLHAADFGFLPLAIHYALQPSVLSDLSGTKLASVVRANPGDTTLAYKTASALTNRTLEQLEYLQSLGTNLHPDVQRIIIRRVLQWWGDPNQWKDRELSLLTSSGDPVLAYLPPNQLETLDDELADRFTSILGQANEIGKFWWLKPMSLKKAWFELAKGSRYFGAVHEWSFRRMQKLSFLLEGASPQDLELIPPIPEIKGLVIGNRYTELQCRVVFDVFYRTGPLSQEQLQEFQYHVVNLIPTQLQRFDMADSFSTLDDMMTRLDQQKKTSYPTLLQISYFMWPLMNTSNGGLIIAPPQMWQKRELSQMGKFLFLLPKSTLFQIPPELINWDSNILQAIRSSHLSTFQIWHLASQILKTIDDRFKPDYVFMIPAPFQQGIPAANMSQVLLGSPIVRPEILRALIEESTFMLSSQKAVIVQRIRMRLGESPIIRNMLSCAEPRELFSFFDPRIVSKNMPTIIKTIMEMPETGRFGVTSVQAKLLPKMILSLWLNWVRENAQITRWTAEDILGRSALGAAHEINLAVLGLSCRDIDIVDPLDILSVILHYRHELYTLRRHHPKLTFNVNLRACVLDKVLNYLKLKNAQNATQTDTHILTAFNYGELAAVGGEILTVIPTQALSVVPFVTQMEIIEEIGRVEMMDLFRICSLPQLLWYGNTLVEDIHLMQQRNVKGVWKRQVNDSMLLETIDEATVEESSDGDRTQTKHLDERLNLSAEFFEKMGNLLCYATEIQVGNWSKRLFQDVLESKTRPGAKTCCIPGHTRNKWFTLLQEAYGPDTTSWSEFELAAIGDLLIVVPQQDLQRISLDSLSKAFSPILKQMGYEIILDIPGRPNGMSFIKYCVEQLETDGSQYFEAYKFLMKRLFQAAQWMVNTVKTTNELIKDGTGRSGRVPRWAEFKLVRQPRQIPFLTTSTSTVQAPAGPMVTFPQPGSASSFAAAGSVQQNPQFSMPAQNPQFAMPSQNTQFSFPAQNTQFATPAQNTQFTMPAQNIEFLATGNFQTTTAGMPQQTQTMASPGLNIQPMAPQQINFQTLPTQTPSFQSQPVQTQAFRPTVATGNYAAAYPATSYYPSTAPSTYSTYQQPTPAASTYQQSAPAAAAGVSYGSPASTMYTSNYEPAPLSPGQILGQAAQQPIVATPQYQTVQQQSGTAGQIMNPTPQQYQSQYQQSSMTPQQPASQQQSQFANSQQFPAQQFQNQQQFQNPQQTFPANQQQFSQSPQFQNTGQTASVDQFQNPQQTFPANQQQFSQSQQFQNPNIGQTASIDQFQNPSQNPNQQFQNQQPFQNPQQNLVANSQVPGNQQFQSNPQMFNNQQFVNPQQFGTPPGGQPTDSTTSSSQNFGGVPGFNQDGSVAGNQPLLPRSLNGSEPRMNTSSASSTTTKTNEEPRSITFGSLQKEEAGQQQQITCHGIKASGSAAIGLTAEDLEKVTPGDLYDCIEFLGTIDWDENMKKGILRLMKEKLMLTPKHITTMTLMEMGNLITAFTVNDNGTEANSSATDTPSNDSVDIASLDLTLPNCLDTLAILGTKITDPQKLKALADKFNTDNKIFPGFAHGIARPDNLRIAVTALRNILCGCNDKMVNSIFETDASLFLDVSCTLGVLEGCSEDVLTTLATHAVRSSNYGPPRLWSQEDVETIGIVFAGLKPDAVSTIPPTSMQGLLPHAVQALSPDILRALKPEQISKFSYSAAAAMSTTQKNSLTETQLQVLNNVLLPGASEFDIPEGSHPVDIASSGLKKSGNESENNPEDAEHPTGIRAAGEGRGIKGRGSNLDDGDGDDDEEVHNKTTTTSTTSTERPKLQERTTAEPEPPHSESSTSSCHRNIYQQIGFLSCPILLLLTRIHFLYN